MLEAHTLIASARTVARNDGGKLILLSDYPEFGLFEHTFQNTTAIAKPFLQFGQGIERRVNWTTNLRFGISEHFIALSKS